MWTWPPKPRVTCRGRSPPGIEMLNTWTGGDPGTSPAVGWVQLFPAPAIAATFGLALLVSRPTELKHTTAVPLLLTCTPALALERMPD